jgi:MFS family permease
VFSLKQAGVPLGGVAAGLGAPFLVDAFGWRTALAVAAAVLILITGLTRPFRPRIDPPRDPLRVRRLVSFRPSEIVGPLLAVVRIRDLWRMSWVGGLLAFPQAVWVTFAATYLVVGLGMSLAVAGLVFATMQASSTFGRVLLGWFADHVASSKTTLALAAVGSALSSIAFGLVTPAWPLWALLLLAAIAGVLVSGWNGVQIAEIARRAPHGMVAETAAGSVILVYASNMLGPIGFAAFVALTGRFDHAFMIAGVVTLICLPLLHGLDRGESKTAS